MMQIKHLSTIFILSALLTGCGGGGSSWDDKKDDDNPAEAPSAPVSLTANAGDQAINLGWAVPTTNGSGSITYEITLTPATTTARFTIQGTTALVRGLSNDTTYTFKVTARNSSGTSPAASIQAQPTVPRTADYSEIVVADNPSPSHGLTSPALLRTASGQIWMAYADVDVSGSGPVLSSSIRLAHSTDNGASYIYDQEVGRPVDTIGLSPNGRWHYRTPWLIEDSSDPNANRRFKLFAHKYFFNNNTNTTNTRFDYANGAIAMWTAATPDGDWSDEQIVVGWAATPAALLPQTRVNQLNAALQSCLWLDEGGASVGSDGIDMVFSCAIEDPLSLELQRKIVLLRSINHTQSFSYVATLLQPADAVAFEASYFSMPALLPGAGTAPVLFASPVNAEIVDEETAQGCVLFPIADAKTGKLFVENDEPLALQTLEPAGVDSGGCAWDRSIPAKGILMEDRAGSDYTIQATGKSL
jgi:hypothetical protein